MSTSPPALADNVVDAISIDPAAAPHRVIRSVGVVTGPDAALPVITTLESFGWDSLLYAAEGVRDREGIGENGVGFRYPDDALNWGEEPGEGVEVYNPLWEVTVSVDAFERLMARFFRSLIAGAEAAGDPVVREPWWPELSAIAAKIEQRAASPSFRTSHDDAAPT